MAKGYIRYCDDGGSLVVKAHCYVQPGDLRQFLRLEHDYSFEDKDGNYLGLKASTKRKLINVAIIFLEGFGITEIETEQVFDGL